MSEQHTRDSLEPASRHRRTPRSDAERTPGADGPARHPLLRLQSQVGNANLARWLAQREQDEDEPVQAKHEEQIGAEGGAVGPDTTARINARRGAGAPLDGAMRERMESGFGASFGAVRVHADAEADALNRRLTARAFTTGNDIFLRGDASPADARLMAHELSHVVQQRSMSSGGGSNLRVGAANDPHEHAADAAAASLPSLAPSAQRESATDEQDVMALHDLALRESASEDEDLAT